MPAKSLPTFDEVYASLDVKALEEERAKAHAANQKAINNIVLSVLAGVACTIMAALLYDGAGIFAGIISGAFIIRAIYKYDLSNKENVEHNLIHAILDCFSDDFEYFPASHISESVVKKSGILSMRMGDDLKGADLVRGYYDDEFVSACHIKVTRTQGKNNHRITVFDGTYIIFSFNKEFKGKTVVLQDFLEKNLGSFGQFLQKTFSWGKLVKLEDAEFEDRFVVYSDDQVEARYLLSTNMMQKLIQLDDESFKGITCCFIDDEIHLAFNGNGELFDMNLSESIDKNTVYKHYETVYQLLKIREFLGIDEKLWSKR